MYTIRFYLRGAGKRPVFMMLVGEGEGERIMRELIERYPTADNVRLEERPGGWNGYFDAPAEARAAA